MIETLRKLRTLLTRSERRRAKLVFALMVAMALMETVGVASVMPFVSVLANPEVIESNPYLRAVYDHIGFDDSRNFLLFLGTVMLGLFIFALSLKAGTNYAMTRYSFMRMHTISCRLLGAYLHQPYEFFLGRNTADLGKTVLSEVEQATRQVILPLMRVLSGCIVVTGILVLLMVVEPVVSLAAAGILSGAYGAIYLIARGFLHRIGKERLKANQERFTYATEALNGIKELQLLGREGAYLKRFRGPSERFSRRQAASRLIGTLPPFGIQAVVFGGVLVVVLYLVEKYGGFEGAMPLITVFAFAGYRLMPAFQEIFNNLTQLRFSRPALDRLYEDLTHKEREALYVNSKNDQPPLRLTNSIRLVDVGYRYPGNDRWAVRKISVEINAGTSVAFVGSTGAGKSTAVDLLLGLLNPTEGKILVDGHSLHSECLPAWQRNIGYVPQAIYLVDDTVTANIAFGVLEKQIDEASVIRAAKIAHIHDFITEELANGYRTVVGERGIRLSGGQRQRLAIARALYHNPDVVVFDEATSALDTETEREVMDAIESLKGEKTIILIAHRLSTVSQCDRVFLLRNGRLAAQGSFEEVIKSDSGFPKTEVVGLEPERKSNPSSF